MRLVRMIANLGYGSQKEVRALIRSGRVTSVDGQDLKADSQLGHDQVLVDGCPLDPPQGIVLMLHKPCGYTCSTEDPGRIVYQLLPPRFMRRRPMVSPVGRLDRDTSGLLLLTDDGQFLHRVASPNHAVPKTYEVRLARPLEGGEADLFAAGTLMLRSETEPLLPAVLESLDPLSARVTIREGRYHQVRRMFAAVGNHVERLHRIAIGELTLEGLEEGQWRYLRPEEVEALR